MVIRSFPLLQYISGIYKIFGLDGNCFHFVTHRNGKNFMQYLMKRWIARIQGRKGKEIHIHESCYPLTLKEYKILNPYIGEGKLVRYYIEWPLEFRTVI